MASDTGRRRGLWRSRWAAVGAAVAVTFGGGALVAVNAALSPTSSVVMITPARILDTRTDVGLPGPFVSAVSQKLKVTGVSVPVGATGVLLNVTVTDSTANGFLSVRPGDALGTPTTSSMNFTAGELIANSVQVGLPTAGANAGKIDITYDAYGRPGPTTEVLIDVVGYMVPAGGPTATGGSITFTGLDATFNGDNAAYSANGCATMRPGTAGLSVPLTLPDGATIVAVRVRSYDDPSIAFPGLATYSLYSVNQGISETLVASFTSVNGLIDTPMVLGPVSPVSLGNTFYLKASTGSLSEQKFCAVTVDYTR